MTTVKLVLPLHAVGHVATWAMHDLVGCTFDWADLRSRACRWSALWCEVLLVRCGMSIVILDDLLWLGLNSFYFFRLLYLTRRLIISLDRLLNLGWWNPLLHRWTVQSWIWGHWGRFIAYLSWVRQIMVNALLQALHSRVIVTLEIWHSGILNVEILWSHLFWNGCWEVRRLLVLIERGWIVLIL